MPQPAVATGQSVPTELAECVVLDVNGASHPLGEAWSDGPALVVFIRHFECVACSMNVTNLAPRIGELAELGVSPTLVGCGPHTAIDRFLEKFSLQPYTQQGLRVWTDPTLKTHRTAGLHRGLLRVIGLRALGNMLRGLASGHSQTGHAGDGAQQGGALMVDAEGVVTFLHRSERLGDFARAVDVVEAALAMRLASVEQANTIVVI